MKHQRSHLYCCLHPCHCRSLTRSPCTVMVAVVAWQWLCKYWPTVHWPGKVGPRTPAPGQLTCTLAWSPAGQRALRVVWCVVICDTLAPRPDIYLLACPSGAVSGCMGRDASHLINKLRIEFEIETEFILTFWISNLYINTTDRP